MFLVVVELSLNFKLFFSMEWFSILMSVKHVSVNFFFMF